MHTPLGYSGLEQLCRLGLLLNASLAFTVYIACVLVLYPFTSSQSWLANKRVHRGTNKEWHDGLVKDNADEFEIIRFCNKMAQRKEPPQNFLFQSPGLHTALVLKLGSDFFAQQR